MDLWNVSRGDVERAARIIGRERGLEVERVHRLTTGLWVEVEYRRQDGSATTVMLTDDMVARRLWNLNHPASV